MKYLIISFLIASVGFCTPKCDETGLTQVFVLPDNVSEMIPYEDGDQILLKHNRGAEIAFDVARESHKNERYCDHCCSNSTYESESLVISSDYPIFDFKIELTATEDSSYYYSIYMGRNCSFVIEQEGMQTFDSVKVNNKYYNEV